MNRDRAIRVGLWLAVVISIMAVAVFVPLALGHPSSLVPDPPPRHIAGQQAVAMGLFGVVFAWLARQVVINRALVLVGGLGKLGFFFTTVAYWLAGDLSAVMVANVLPDLVLGAGFVLWAVTERDPRIPNLPRTG